MSIKIDHSAGFLNIRGIPFELDEGIGASARIGVIVLATDHTNEHEFRQIVNMPGVALYESRIPNSPKINSETLLAMENHISEHAALILPEIPFDVMAYGCTSASMVIGEKRVFELLRAGRPEAIPTTPITAAFAAFHALNVKRLAILTPYRDDINRLMRNYIQARGFEVPIFGSFNEDDDNRAARITTNSIRDAVLEVGKHEQVDGVFLSCTSLRLTNIVDQLERELGKPVTSSNHAIIWHSLRLGGVDKDVDGYGSLFHLAI